MDNKTTLFKVRENFVLLVTSESLTVDERKNVKDVLQDIFKDGFFRVNVGSVVQRIVTDAKPGHMELCEKIRGLEYPDYSE